MSLIREYISSGEELFKKRSYVPLLLLPLVIIVMLFSNDYPQNFAQSFGWKMFALFVGMCGMAYRAWVIGQVPAGTSGRNTHGQVAEVLNTTGPYSVVRHPLYVGNFIIILGIVLWAGVWWLVLLYCLLFWVYYERIMMAEENFIHGKFGKDFEEWSSRVPAFLPSFKNYVPSKLDFSFKNVLRREYSGLINLVLSFFILERAHDLIFKKEFPLFDFWMNLLLGTLIFTLFLRFLKKKTEVLYVEGR
jgi:protein-S-isoprenylcysteine O-methyltransferase Ste14